MSKTMLIVVIGAAVLAVGAFGAVTATVIVTNGDGGARAVQLSRVQPAPTPALPGHGMPPLGRRGGHGERGFGPGSGPLPGMRGPGGLRECLGQHGLGGPGKRGALPGLKTMRDALKACRGSLPGRAP